MPLLPDLGQTEDTENWSSTQKWSFAICTYLIIILLAAVLVLALMNFVRHIVK